MLVSQFVGAVIGVLVAFNLGVNDEQAALWLAAINALVALATAIIVRPVAPALVTGAFTATVMLTAGYGFELAPQQVSAINLVLAMGLAFFFTRPNSTPASSPALGQGVTSKDVAVSPSTHRPV